MEKSLLRRRQTREQGFTLIETLVAISVLTIGLMSVAALMAQMVGTSSRSRYMSTAALLGSEKLEDLTHYSSRVPPASIAAGGSLAADVAGFFDTIRISSGNGVSSETTSENGVATTITHQPDGTIAVVAGGAAPADPDALTFDRRWLIQTGTPVNGMRTITVLVTLQNQPANAPSVTFQASTVRP
jgi:prepilin-type N-terminal cleavage/methylation domain-containing protein